MAEWIVQLRARLLTFDRRARVYMAAGCILGFLFSCAPMGAASLGSAAVAAFYIAGYPLGALLGALSGALLFRGYQQALVLLLYALFGVIAYLARKSLTAANKLLLLLGAWVFTFPLYNFADLNALLTGCAMLCLALLGAVGVAGGLRAAAALMRGRTPRDGEQLFLCGTGALLCCALARWSIAGVAAGVYAACLFALLAAYARGVLAVGACVLFAAGCILGGADIALAGCLAVCTLCAAAARGERALCAGAFLAGAVVLRVFVSTLLSPVAAGFAAAALLCLPRCVLRPLRALDTPDRELQKLQAAQKTLRKQLQDMADVLQSAAPLFADADGFALRQIRAISSALDTLAKDRARPRRQYALRVGASALPKAGSRQTGDSMGVRDVRGRILLLLSDGMGSGRAAHEESAAAVALLGDLLSIGFDLPEALECVNRLLMQRRSVDGEDMFATMDALLFDLFEGQAQFIKYGAPPSYILREGKLQTLYAEALPAGILREARPALHVAPLRRGDRVVLMTDGAFEALGAELSRTLLAELNAAEDPDAAAKALLLCARQKSGADDMTVIVAEVR